MSLLSEVSSLNSIFFDTAPIIYYIEAHQDYGPLMKDLVVSFQSGELIAFTSVITITEVLPKPVSQNQKKLIDKFIKFFKKGGKSQFVGNNIRYCRISRLSEREI